jgi:hypothetical protein
MKFNQSKTKRWPARKMGAVLNALALLMMLALLGCSGNPGFTLQTPTFVPPQPTSTPAPALDTACLQGEWVITNMQETISDVNAMKGSSLRVTEIGGTAIYRFLPDGEMEIEFDRLTVSFSGMVDGKPISARDRMDGVATANYRVDGTQEVITFTNFGGDDITFIIHVDGKLLAEGSLPAWKIFSSVTGQQRASASRTVTHARASAECSGADLTIQALDPIPGPAVRLTKVR